MKITTKIILLCAFLSLNAYAASDDLDLLNETGKKQDSKPKPPENSSDDAYDIPKGKKSRKSDSVDLESAANENMGDDSDLQSMPGKKKKKKSKDAKDGEDAEHQADNKKPEKVDYFKRTDIKSDLAFKALVDSAYPLTPEQTIELRKLADRSQVATFTTAKAPPKALSSSIQVSLEPGAVHPVIRLAAGFVTSMVFVDQTGAPWPIVAYDIGDSSAFNVQWDSIGNTMFLQSMQNYAHGNMAVRLKDLNTPVMISLVAGQREVDYRIDLQIQSRSAGSAVPTLTTATIPANVKPAMMHILDGIPPEKSRKLEVMDGLGQAWVVDNKLYFRSKLKIISPAWDSMLTSADGTHVYELAQTPTILSSVDGHMVNIKIKGL